MNARFVIATSTKIDVSKVDATKINDDFFKRDSSSAKKGEEAFSKKAGEKKAPNANRKAAQQKVDTGILAAIGKDAVMKKYLASKFALSNGDNAHELKF